MAKEKTCGIYCIENTVNGKRYIGSSNNIYRRWAGHKLALKKQEHHSMFLQRAWNKYGADNFNFFIIETTSIEDRINREQYWMDYYESYKRDKGYNVSNKVDAIPHRISSYDTLSAGKHKITWDQFVRVVFWLNLFDDPIPYIAEQTGVSRRNIYQIYFRENYGEMTKGLPFKKRIIGRSARKLSEEVVKQIIVDLCNGEHHTDIARKYDVSASTVGDIYKKRYWKELSDGIDFPKAVKAMGRFRKPVSQYDLSNNLLATYESARDAERKTGICYKYISKSCNSGSKTHNYYFRFTESEASS